MKNLTDDRSDCGGKALLPAPVGSTGSVRRLRISHALRLRYDLIMPRSFFPMTLLFALSSASVQAVNAIEAVSALLFAADVVTDAGAAAREAAAMTGGRVLDVQTVREGERQAFHVKVLLDDGRVKLIELGGEPHDTPDSNDE